MAEVAYQWRIDWNDDLRFDHPLTDVSRFVESHNVEYGGDIGLTASRGRVLTVPGQVTLNDDVGRFWQPGTAEQVTAGSRLSAAQLELPHRFQLSIGGVPRRFGIATRADAVAGLNITPATFILEGPHHKRLREAAQFTHAATTMNVLVLAIETASGIDLATSSMAAVGAINYSGTWAGLIDDLAEHIGGIAVELPNGQVSILTPDELRAPNDPTLFAVDMGASISQDGGIGRASGLVRTRAQVGANTITAGDEDVYGIREVQSPASWRTNMAESQAALDFRAEPLRFVVAEVDDNDLTGDYLRDVPLFMDVGQLSRLTYPTPGGAQSQPMRGIKTTLSGTYTGPALREVVAVGEPPPPPRPPRQGVAYTFEAQSGGNPLTTPNVAWRSPLVGGQSILVARNVVSSNPFPWAAILFSLESGTWTEELWDQVEGYPFRHEYLSNTTPQGAAITLPGWNDEYPDDPWAAQIASQAAANRAKSPKDSLFTLPGGLSGAFAPFSGKSSVLIWIDRRTSTEGGASISETFRWVRSSLVREWTPLSISMGRILGPPAPS